MDKILFPTITNSVAGDQEITLFFTLPSDLMYFEGHFDGTPVLPGVVQTHWAEHYGRKFLPVEGEYAHLEAVKFQHVIRPNLLVELNLRYDNAAHKLYYRYQSANGSHSSGRIVYKP